MLPRSGTRKKTAAIPLFLFKPPFDQVKASDNPNPNHHNKKKRNVGL